MEEFKMEEFKRLDEFEAYIKCAKDITEELKGVIGIKVSPFAISHSMLTFVKYDTISKKAYVFNAREATYYEFIANERDEYFVINPLKIDNWVTMALSKVEILVNGRLKATGVITTVQNKAGV